MRDTLITQAKQTKKVVRRALTQQHPDANGDPQLYAQIKPLFDQANDIIHQAQICPDVMIKPFLGRLSALESQLQSILGSTPKQTSFSQPAPKTRGKSGLGAAVSAAQARANRPKPKASPKPKSTPKPQPATAPPDPKPQTDPTKQLYTQLGDITEFLNSHLFGGVLPQPVIRLQVKKNMLGYITAKKTWQYGQTNIKTYELGLNPVYFQSRPLLDLFNTIAHELTHEYCSELHGSSTTYHDKRWMAEALKIGLEPVGKGTRVDTKVIPGGLVDNAYHKFMGQHPGFSIDWFNATQQQQSSGKGSVKKSKQKYTCPACAQNAWAKPGAKLVCGACFENMQEN